jgi:hypothetical protein
MLAALLLVIGGAVAHASVTLSRFIGEWNESGDAVRLQWSTGSETNHAYFNLWRSTVNLPIGSNGQIDTSRATKLNTAPITSPSACSPGSYDYPIYTDATVSPTVNTYYYYLESINCTSGSEFAGAATGGGLEVTRETNPVNTFLPLIWRQ